MTLFDHVELIQGDSLRKYMYEWVRNFSQHFWKMVILFGPQSKIHALLIYLCCSNSFSLTLEKANFLRKLIFHLEVLNYSKDINAGSDFKNSGGVRYFEWLKSTIPIPYLEFYPDTTFFESPRHFYLPPPTRPLLMPPSQTFSEIS